MKTKVIELLYSWTLALPEESKIKDAYHMLKRQGTRVSAQAGGTGLSFEGLRCVWPAGLVPGAPPCYVGKGARSAQPVRPLLRPLSGIVHSDPLISVDRTLIPSPPPRPKNPVFDDEEKSKVKSSMGRGLAQRWGVLGSCVFPSGCCRPSASNALIFQLLARLLKSKNPDDLQEANKLIKSMVKEVGGP